MQSSTLDVPKLAIAYRRLVLWFGGQLVIAVFGPVLSLVAGETPLGTMIALLGLLGWLVTVCALTYYAFRTASALGSLVAIVWAIAMFVPYINAITLLVLSSKATKACREAGVPVGFLGPQVSDSVPESQHTDSLA